MANNERSDTKRSKKCIASYYDISSSGAWADRAPALPMLVRTRSSCNECHTVSSASGCVQPSKIAHSDVGSLSVTGGADGGFLDGSRADAGGAQRRGHIHVDVHKFLRQNFLRLRFQLALAGAPLPPDGVLHLAAHPHGRC